jgi:hypothetical protein
LRHSSLHVSTYWHKFVESAAQGVRRQLPVWATTTTKGKHFHRAGEADMTRVNINDLTVQRNLDSRESAVVGGARVAIRFGGSSYPYGYPYGCEPGYDYGYDYGYYTYPQLFFGFGDYGHHGHGHRHHGHHGHHDHGRGRRGHRRGHHGHH